jgi:hypothetical protein
MWSDIAAPPDIPLIPGIELMLDPEASELESFARTSATSASGTAITAISSAAIATAVDVRFVIKFSLGRSDATRR